MVAKKSTVLPKNGSNDGVAHQVFYHIFFFIIVRLCGKNMSYKPTGSLFNNERFSKLQTVTASMGRLRSSPLYSKENLNEIFISRAFLSFFAVIGADNVWRKNKTKRLITHQLQGWRTDCGVVVILLVLTNCGQPAS